MICVELMINGKDAAVERSQVANKSLVHMTSRWDPKE